MTYTMDDYDECVVTSTDTVAQLAQDMFMRGHVVTTWTDGMGSKFDLSWSFDATRIGRSSMVDPGPGKVFVGVVGKGCFGFSVSSGYLAPSYVEEKLNVTGSTAVALAALIAYVREDMVKLVKEDVRKLLKGGCVNDSPEHLAKYTKEECEDATRHGR